MHVFPYHTDVSDFQACPSSDLERNKKRIQSVHERNFLLVSFKRHCDAFSEKVS